MLELLNVLSILVAVAAAGWLVGVFLLRLICVSLTVFSIVTLLLAGQGEQDPLAPLGLGALAIAFWIAWQLLYRARYGWWRSPRAATMADRMGGLSRRGWCQRPAQRGGQRVGRSR